MLLPAPLAAFAQPSPPRIAVVDFGRPSESVFARHYLAALKDLGYAEPATLTVERRYANGDAAQLSEVLQQLAAEKVDLVFTIGDDLAQTAKRIAPALRVVTAGSDDPVMSGLIADYRRPGGNITGVTYLSTQLAGKRLQILKEALPTVSHIAVLWDPSHSDTYYRDMSPVARSLGVQLRLFEVRNPQEISGAVAAARKDRADVLFVLPSRLLNAQAGRINELALQAKLPVMSAYANITEAGGLMSYGAQPAELLKRAAVQSARILKGASPGDLPFEQASTFELVINVRTAKALGLAIPQAVLLRADRLIE